MAIALLRGENFRLYRTLEIEPHPQLNLIVGDNAAGKTTLLEALYVTARGRSFRAANPAEMSGSARPGWTTFFHAHQDGSDYRVGLGWDRAGTELRLNEQKGARLSEVVRAVPLQIIDPLSHRLLDEGPAFRRSYVDWGVFHVEHRFHEVWRRFQRALQQRNRALREEADDRTVQAWNEDLSVAAEDLTGMREAHIRAAAPSLSAICGRLLGEEGIRVDFLRGWAAGESYREVLHRNLDQHRRQGTTLHGPHRAELRIEVPQGRARTKVSRGQQKLIVTAMILAQCQVMLEVGRGAPILLLDDFAAELSAESQARLAVELLQYPGQKFVTSFEPFSGWTGQKGRLFHVEQGTIRTVDGLL